ncbi:MAG: glucosaminidase domain-containing protein [Chitinophagaceae bacterium]
MKLIIAIVCVFITSLQVFSQKDKAIVYIENYKDLAIAEMHRSGIPAAITLAQGLFESGYGEGELCKKSNNHFGIKCKTEWQGEKVYHNDDAQGECFRKYNTAAESFKDHSDFLVSRPHYGFLFKLDPTDYVGWAKGLKKAGYATDKAYPERLIKVINDYNLQAYTLQALTQKNDNDALAKNTESIIKDTVLGEIIIPMSSKKQTQKSIVQTAVSNEEDSVVIINPSTTKKEEITANKTVYPSGIFTINHTKVIFAEKGTSLLSIARQYDISLAKLLEFNDMEEVDVLEESQLLFLEKKLTKGSIDVHIVADNETLHSISQKEGIRLEKLLEYNKLQKNSGVKNGDKLFLRPINTNVAR